MSAALKLLLATLLVMGPFTGFFMGRWTAPATGNGPVLEELARQRVLLEGRLAAREVRVPSEVRCAVGTSALDSGDMARLKTELVQAVRDELAIRTEERASDEAARVPMSE